MREDDEMRRPLWTSVLLGAGLLVVVASGARSSQAAFPGKNGLIAFQSFRDGYAQIYTMTDAPTQPKLVKRQQNSCYALPAWSRDGKKIAFEYNPDTAGRPARRSEIYLMNADGTGLKPLTRNRVFDGDPSWSPDGRYVVFESERDGNSELYRADVRTLKVKRLTNHKAFDGDPTWSPFGRGIAFTSMRTGNREIFLMRFDADKGPSLRSPLLNLTNNRASDFDPTWSPNGQLVTFVSDRDGNLEIYATNDRFLLQRLTAHPSLDAFPAWSPDARSIVFVSDRNDAGNRDLYVMKSDGTSVRKLTESANWDVAPDWGSVTPGAAGKPPPLPAPRQPRGDSTSALACVVR
jgi:Tol biopolymer transport system component